MKITELMHTEAEAAKLRHTSGDSKSNTSGHHLSVRSYGTSQQDIAVEEQEGLLGMNTTREAGIAEDEYSAEADTPEVQSLVGVSSAYTPDLSRQSFGNSSSGNTVRDI